MSLGKIVTVPFSALLRFLYNLCGSYGWALVLFTVVIKLILLPFQLKSKRSMLRMNRLNPKVQEIQKKYEGNRDKINEETARLYEESGVNPMSGCVWSLIPFPILIALYAIIRKPLTDFMNLAAETVTKIFDTITASGYTFTYAETYKEIEASKYIFQHMGDFGEYTSQGLLGLNYDFYGIDLASIPSNFLSSLKDGGWAAWGLIVVAVLAGVSGLLFSIVSMKTSGQKTEGSSKTMMYLMPLLSAYIAFIMPAALGIYWIANNVASMVQDVFLNKFYSKKLDAEEEEREQKREAVRKYRQEEGKRIQEEQKNMSEKEKKKAKKLQAQEDKTDKVSTNENGRVGDRPYARGRAYREDRYNE